MTPPPTPAPAPAPQLGEPCGGLRHAASKQNVCFQGKLECGWDFPNCVGILPAMAGLGKGTLQGFPGPVVTCWLYPATKVSLCNALWALLKMTPVHGGGGAPP